MTEMIPPDYFYRVVERIDELKTYANVPVLEGVFNNVELTYQSVKNPKYVISELLQNADDCHASSVKITIQKNSETNEDEFIFEHDGNDFDEKDFNSLCSIAASSKKTLDTIGFRGIGFKSCFSLGKKVHLRTPTLSVYFDDDDYIYPHWEECETNSSKKTRIRIPLTVPSVLPDFRKSYEMWKNSPKSLLFFKHIKKLEIDNKLIFIEEIKLKICNNAYKKIINITDLSNDSYNKKIIVTMISSNPLYLPEDIIKEIIKIRPQKKDSEKQKQLIDEWKSNTIKIDILIDNNDDNRIFVVLPVINEHLRLPFSINAPFILTPARDQLLSDAEQTNKWIFEKTGELLISSFKEWIENKSLTIKERADAYQLIPSKILDDIVASKFSDYIKENPIVIDYSGNLSLTCTIIPTEFYDIWDYDELNTLFHPKNPYLSHEVIGRYVNKLNEWDLLSTLDPEYHKLFTKDKFPVPKNKEKILSLVIYILDKYFSPSNPIDGWSLPILPTKEYDYFYSKKKIFLPYRNISSIHETYKKLLEKYLLFVDTDFISKINSCKNINIVRYIEDVLKSNKYSTTKEIIKELSQCLTKDKENVDTDDIIQLGHFAAYLDIVVGNDFPYLTQDNNIESASHNIIADSSDILDKIFPTQKIQNRLNKKYWDICFDKQSWEQWVESEKSLLSKPLALEKIVGNPNFPDYSLNQTIVTAANSVATSDSNDKDIIWVLLFKGILSSYKQSGIKKYLYVYKDECCTWIQQFRDKPCLIGTDGKPHLPKELYFKNEDTELLEGELFLSSQYSSNLTDGLLDLYKELGVRFEPSVPTALLNRLLQYSLDVNTPIEAVLKEYNLLDRIFKSTSLETRKTIKEYIEKNQLVLTEDIKWQSLSNVYVDNTGGLPNKYIIITPARNLHIWKELRVKAAPDLDDMIVFLNKLPRENVLPAAQEKFILESLKAYPEKIIESTNCWISCDGYWRKISDFEYYISDNSYIEKLGLYPEYMHKIPLTITMEDYQVAAIVRKYFNVKDLLNSISWEICDINYDPQKTTPFELSWLTDLGNNIRNIPDWYDDAKTMHLLGVLFSRTNINYVISYLLSPFLNNKRIGLGFCNGLYWGGTKNPSVYITDNYLQHYDLSDNIQALNFKIADELLRVLKDENNIDIDKNIKAILYSAINCESRNMELLLKSLLKIDNNKQEKIKNNCGFNLGLTPNGRISINDDQTINKNISTLDSNGNNDDSLSLSSLTTHIGVDDNSLKHGDNTSSTSQSHSSSSSKMPKNNREKLLKKLRPSQSHKSNNKKVPDNEEDEYNKSSRPSSTSEKYLRNFIAQVRDGISSPDTFDNEKVYRLVSENSNTEERNVLKQFYKDGHCQICGEIIEKENGNPLFCAVNILPDTEFGSGEKSTENLGWNSLMLCPNCAVKYKYCNSSFFEDKDSANLTDDELIETFKKKIYDIDDDGAVVPLEIFITGEKETIKFDSRHFKRFKGGLTAMFDWDKENID